MQIVIDVSEKEYADICKRHGRLSSLVRSGTPLPKGHGALKDADKLAIAIAMIRDRCNYYGNEYESALFQAYDICVDEIIDAPPIIEADKEGAECDNDCEHCEWVTCPKMEGAEE